MSRFSGWETGFWVVQWCVWAPSHLGTGVLWSQVPRYFENKFDVGTDEEVGGKYTFEQSFLRFYFFKKTCSKINKYFKPSPFLYILLTCLENCPGTGVLVDYFCDAFARGCIKMPLKNVAGEW